MSSTPDRTLDDPQKIIADLRGELAQRTAERDEAQRRLAESTAERDDGEAQQAAITEVLGVINSSPGDLTPVFDAILEKAHNLCGSTHGALASFDGEHFRVVATRGLPDSFVELFSEPFRPHPGSLEERLVIGDAFVHVPDVAALKSLPDNPITRAAIDLTAARTILLLPLRKDGALLGCFSAHRKEVWPFSEKEIALLQNFAAQAVIAMENARLLTETREALEQQTATAEVLGVINSSPGDLALVFDVMLEKATRLCGAQMGAFWTYDGENMRAEAVRGAPPQFIEFLKQGPHRPAAGQQRLLQGARIIHTADITESEAYRSADPLSHAAADLGGIRTLLVVPLRKDDALLGTIGIYRQEVRPFTDKQIALLENFAAQAVIAMENARLLTETREALEQQTATAEVLQIINSSPGDLAPVFDAMLERAVRLCELDFASLWTYDGTSFCPVAKHRVPEPLMEYMQEHTPPAFARLVGGDRLVHVADVQGATNQTDFTRNVRRLGLDTVRSILIVPLRKDETLLGLIATYRREVGPFADKQIALLENFAAQAVIAMENARLLGELRQRTEEVGELNRDLEARVAEQVDELGRVGRLKRFLAPQLAELIVSQGDEKILESHRREIVVVFCDLRGYTAFTETAEPEEVLDFLRQYHGALGPLVSQFEGTLDQFSGDGIMVFFNDPVPCPDPAERAVKMAVAMREAAGALIVEWRERGGDLGFGAGIAQGYATLGQIGFSERSGYTAIGTVCNVAARLCAEAKDGQILLSQLVNVALRGSVTTEQLGPLTLKGLTQPVVAFNVPLAAIQPALRVIEGGDPQSV